MFDVIVFSSQAVVVADIGRPLCQFFSGMSRSSCVREEDLGHVLGKQAMRLIAPNFNVPHYFPSPHSNAFAGCPGLPSTTVILHNNLCNCATDVLLSHYACHLSRNIASRSIAKRFIVRVDTKICL